MEKVTIKSSDDEIYEFIKSMKVEEKAALLELIIKSQNSNNVIECTKI